MRMKILAAVGVVLLPLVASAAWQPVLTEQGKRVEIDTESIVADANGGATAKGRIVLDKPIVDPKTSASYRIIEVVNHFDCNGRTLATQKRVYYKEEGEVLRQEDVKSLFDVPVRSGTPDEKLFREACRPKGEAGSGGKDSVETAGKTLEKANEAAAGLRKTNEEMVAQALAQDARKNGEKAGNKGAEKSTAKSAAKNADQALEKIVEQARSRQAAMEPAAPRHARCAACSPAPHEPVASLAAVAAHADMHWGYEGEGAPENWGKLNPANAVCAEGRRQSPIDIHDGIRVDLEPIVFNYRPSGFRVSDNGHTIQVTLPAGYISLLGTRYQLEQIHFHRPSEELVDGRRFDMVAHLVHKSEDGKIAVVAVLLDRGAENPFIQTVWNNLPLEKNSDVAPPTLSLDPSKLLPENRSYYTYMGSLTTPPCTEGVLWLVLKEPQPISEAQIAIFSRLYRNNARPIQPGFGRLIKESR